VDWLHTHEPDIAIDPVILGELSFGVLRLPPGKKRTAFERCFDAGVGCLSLPSLGCGHGLEMGGTAGTSSQTGKAIPIKDSFIAATAMVHSLAVVTRNHIDFAKAGVPVIDPFIP
jgi:predicted nucleic acid-binding protein